MTPAEFKLCCEEHFAYLTDYGFRAEPPPKNANRWQHRFANSTTRIVITNYSYGINLAVTLTRRSQSPDDSDAIYFADRLVRLRNKRFYNKKYSQPHDGTIADQIRYYAEEIREHLSELLRGDFELLESHKVGETKSYG